MQDASKATRQQSKDAIESMTSKDDLKKHSDFTGWMLLKQSRCIPLKQMASKQLTNKQGRPWNIVKPSVAAWVFKAVSSGPGQL